MKNLKERQEVIDYSIKLNTTNLSPLRSGNISVRGIEEGVEGFFITPSGKKYETLKRKKNKMPTYWPANKTLQYSV